MPAARCSGNARWRTPPTGNGGFRPTRTRRRQPMCRRPWRPCGPSVFVPPTRHPQYTRRSNVSPTWIPRFLYRAVQKYGDLKPVTTLVHVLIGQEAGRDCVASTLIYANHDTEAAFVPAELIPVTDPAGRTQTIVAYSVGVQTDLPGGQLGFLKKKFARSKLLSTLRGGLTTLRTTVLAASRAREAGPAGVHGSAGFQPADQKTEDNPKLPGF
jgi:hypothetical protein